MASDIAIELVIGLGNPGEEHARTRHNAGFWVVDELVRRARGSWSEERKFHGELAKCTIGGREVRLLKPMTYMNRSGLSAQSLMGYLKLAPEQVLVVHDEIDLPNGTVRLKWDGGHGGHNGLRDLNQHLGTQYRRVRVGVGRPANSADVVDYVLERPRKEEQPLLDDAVLRAADAVELIVGSGMEKAMLKLHTNGVAEKKEG
jgi:PTH1 family peptidyl-tRNA hydrolase